jgi:hypothetical protein
MMFDICLDAVPIDFGRHFFPTLIMTTTFNAKYLNLICHYHGVIKFAHCENIF